MHIAFWAIQVSSIGHYEIDDDLADQIEEYVAQQSGRIYVGLLETTCGHVVKIEGDDDEVRAFITLFLTDLRWLTPQGDGNLFDPLPIELPPKHYLCDVCMYVTGRACPTGEFVGDRQIILCEACSDMHETNRAGKPCLPRFSIETAPNGECIN